MVNRIALLAVMTVYGAIPAAAREYTVRWADGSPREKTVIFLIILAVLCFVIFAVVLVSTSSSPVGSFGGRYPLGAPTQPVEYYEDQAARYRAIKRELDAQIDLAESYINARRTRAELEDLPDALQNDGGKRRP